jgi:hypothetical protein
MCWDALQTALHQKQISFYPDYTVGPGVTPDLLTP